MKTADQTPDTPLDADEAPAITLATADAPPTITAPARALSPQVEAVVEAWFGRLFAALGPSLPTATYETIYAAREDLRASLAAAL